jgi:hypothetical protein
MQAIAEKELDGTRGMVMLALADRFLGEREFAGNRFPLGQYLYFLRYVPLTSGDADDPMEWSEELSQRLSFHCNGDADLLWEHVTSDGDLNSAGEDD